MSRQSRAELAAAVMLAYREQETTVDILDELAIDRLGLNRTNGRCVDVIEREGPVSAGRLAEVTGLSSGAVTAVIDRLERERLARRTDDPTDRRRVLVELTPEGHRACDAIYGPLEEDAGAIMAGYSRADLELLLDFFTRGSAVIERHIERVRAMPGRSPRAER